MHLLFFLFAGFGVFRVTFTHLALDGHGKSLKLFAGQWRRRRAGGQRVPPAVARPAPVAGAGSHGAVCVVCAAGVVVVVVPVARDAGKRVEERTRGPPACPVGAPCALGRCRAPTAVVAVAVAVAVAAACPGCGRTAGRRPVVEAGAEKVVTCASVPCCCRCSHAGDAVTGGQRTTMWRPDTLLSRLVARTAGVVVVVVVRPSSQGW